MTAQSECSEGGIPQPLEMSDEDVYEAMKKIPGYLDITPDDFKEVYVLAFRHAVERLTRSAKAKDVMTKEVVYVTGETTLKEVARTMARQAISGVPVVDEDQMVVGVLSEKDFLSNLGAKGLKTFMGVVAECLAGSGCLAVSVRGRRAADIMSSPAVTVDEHTPIPEVSEIFRKRKINRVPVVDKEGRLAGMLSRADVLQSVFCAQ